MIDYANWFRLQLQSSADGFVWAFGQLPKDYHFLMPPNPDYMGTWPPIRHIWHVAGYERCLVIPSMRQWFETPVPNDIIWDDSNQGFAAAQEAGLQGIVEHFLQVRRQQIEMLDELTNVDWEAARATLWGNQPLKMIVTKTYQHTFEHADTLLRMALWWKEPSADPADQANYLLGRGEQAFKAQEFTQARMLIAQGLALYQTMGNELGIAHAQLLDGILAYEEGDYATARVRQEAVLTCCRAHQHIYGMAESLKQLGLIAAKEGDLSNALSYWQESLQSYQTLGNPKESAVIRMLIRLFQP